MRILIVSSESLPGSEDRNLPLVEELIRRGHDVRHTGPSQALVKAGFTSTAFAPEFVDWPQATVCRTRLFDDWAQLNRMIAWAQVVVFSMAKGYQEAAEYAAGLSKLIVYLADTSLHPWVWKADLIAAGSPYERDRMASLTGEDRVLDNRWARLYPLDDPPPVDIVVTGSTIMDQAAPQNSRLSKTDFLQKYGLDPAKRTAVWLPSSPACHDSWFKELYGRICASVEREAGFNLIIKPHPRDYVQAKQWATYEDAATPTWEQLAPGVTVCRAEDKWGCFRAADVLISSWTTTAIEAGLVRTPMLLVDYPAFSLNIIKLNEPRFKELLPRTRYTPPSRRTLGRVEPLLEILWDRVDSRTQAHLKERHTWEQGYYQVGSPEYIGTDCTMEELPRVLREGLYRFDNQKVFDEYAARYSAGLDGRAFLRIADLIESVEGYPVLAAKLRAQRSLTLKYGAPLRQSLSGTLRRIRNRLALS